MPSPAHCEIIFDFEHFHKAMESRFGEEQAELSMAWEKMLKDIECVKVEKEKIIQVSRFFHARLGHESDLQLWEVDDYWATPLEFMGQGRGDCNDWAVAKYFSLRISGIKDHKLRLLYVTARVDKQKESSVKPHMVLVYYPYAESDPFVLDNLIPCVLPLSQRKDLSPIFSFNSQGLWTGSGGNAAFHDSTDSLLRWNDLLDRVRNEGAEWQLNLSPSRKSAHHCIIFIYVDDVKMGLTKRLHHCIILYL